MGATTPLLLGVDVGGTFTDAVLVSNGSLFRAKVPTTVDQSLAVVEASRKVIEMSGAAAAQVSYFAHGMTTATNALLERKGARTASISTWGFRDILEIGRQDRPRLYDLCPSRPEPLVPRELRLAARERVGPVGETLPLEAEEVKRVVDRLRRLKPEAVAICLLFSFLDPAHELRLGEVLARELPEVHVSMSSAVLPQFREYERFSTTAVDAYLTPVVARYLMTLGERVRTAGLPEPAIMQSSGGVMPLGQAAASAAPLLLSGPAAGVVGSIYGGGRSGIDDLIAFDMGGTSTDVSLVRGGAAQTTSEREIGGQPVALPMVDIHTIGAGGGSIAWIDPGGALRVGPESAGAEPGPACYGRGGEQATVSDANYLLGYLGEKLGGADGLALQREPARKALGRLAAELGLELEETALGIRRVVGAEMVKALRVISVERGHDPRMFVLVAFGGAGPMHGADLAEELDIERVMVPDSCGVLSALGMVVGDERRDWVQTVYAAEGWDEQSLAGSLARMEAAHAAETVGAVLERRADMRYRGQSHELTVEVGERMSRDELVRAFEHEHEKAYGYTAAEEDVELVNIRLTALRPLVPVRIGDAGRERKSARGPARGTADGREQTSRDRSAPGSRSAFFDGEWVQADIWRRGQIGATRVRGPAIIEEDEATTVVPPGWECSLDEAGNLWLETHKLERSDA
ncbi:MAG: hydantoinase/oxoprolinase family protein [Thermoleophilia bacterium]|nr:hydantoinase/oxoprolinase family protein [Thermoleophilia bacterium]